MKLKRPERHTCVHVKRLQEVYIRATVDDVRKYDGRITVTIRRSDGEIEWRYGVHLDDVYILDEPPTPAGDSQE